MQIKIESQKLLLIFFLSPMLFADAVMPSLTELIPQDILPFQTINRANEAYEKEEFRKSATLFQSLKIEDPTVLYNQANAEYKAGMYDDALKHYAKSKGVGEATRLYNMGNSYFKKGDFKSAIKQYTASLKLKSDDDVMHNLKLAREKRKEKEEQKQKDKKKKDKNKKKRDKKKEEQKKRKQEDKKKDDRKKESDKKNSKSKKEADASKKQEEKEKMSPKEKMRKKELSHLIKQLSKKKMPTMMYQGKENKGERHDKNPW